MFTVDDVGVTETVTGTGTVMLPPVAVMGRAVAAAEAAITPESWRASVPEAVALSVTVTTATTPSARVVVLTPLKRQVLAEQLKLLPAALAAGPMAVVKD